MTGATGLGSLPGTDAGAAVRVAFEVDEPGWLPWLPELPARGPWAGMLGRGTALLEGLSAELGAGEWRLSATPGIDGRRARATLRDDLDVLEENAHAATGPVKVSVCGPWTLASSIFRPLGGRVVGDRGARRDVGQSLLAGTEALLGELRRRFPGVEWILQVDEPSLPAVLAGRVPTEGGYFRHRAVEEAEVADLLGAFTELGATAVVHCCAGDVPVGLLTRRRPNGAGFAGISLDAALLGRSGWDAVATAVEEGRDVYLGVADAGAPEEGPDPIVRRALGWLRPLELGPVLADRLRLTHSCGLAGATPSDLRGRLASLRSAARIVDEALRD